MERQEGGGKHKGERTPTRTMSLMSLKQSLVMFLLFMYPFRLIRYVAMRL